MREPVTPAQRLAHGGITFAEYTNLVANPKPETPSLGVATGNKVVPPTKILVSFHDDYAAVEAAVLQATPWRRFVYMRDSFRSRRAPAMHIAVVYTNTTQRFINRLQCHLQMSDSQKGLIATCPVQLVPGASCAYVFEMLRPAINGTTARFIFHDGPASDKLDEATLVVPGHYLVGPLGLTTSPQAPVYAASQNPHATASTSVPRRL